MSWLERIDFSLGFTQEIVAENGEDSFCFASVEGASMACVCDGCGGSGARKYANFQDKSGAYMASRAVTGAALKWFGKGVYTADAYKQAIDANLKVLTEHADQVKSLIRSSMVMAFPTTMVTAVVHENGGRLCSSFFWAGDSRGYILDSRGLHQITADDITGGDAMENLLNDSPMTNVISADNPYAVRQNSVVVKEPCVVLCATDGCFGYLKSPMQFELLLLDTLCESTSPDDWEARLRKTIAAFAGDDYSIALQSLDFGDYEGMKSVFRKRRKQLIEWYFTGRDLQSTEETKALWGHYKQTYETY